jgi:hypothetical protein
MLRDRRDGDSAREQQLVGAVFVCERVARDFLRVGRERRELPPVSELAKADGKGWNKKGREGYDFENAQSAGDANEEYDAKWAFVDDAY